MPPRTNDPSKLIAPILERFTRKLAQAIERQAFARVAEVLKKRTARRKRRRVLCYYPGCKNVAAPRFGMFCAAEHKLLPKAEKARIKAARRAAVY